MERAKVIPVLQITAVYAYRAYWRTCRICSACVTFVPVHHLTCFITINWLMSAYVDDESSLKGDERRVLSEVHLRRGDSNTTTYADSGDGVMISRYQYLVPAPSSVQVDDDGRKSSSPQSSSGDSESDGDILIRRRRKRRRAASLHESCAHPQEVLTVVHKLETPVILVGQQVWSAAFQLGDFILTHEELFAGANVRTLIIPYVFFYVVMHKHTSTPIQFSV